MLSVIRRKPSVVCRNPHFAGSLPSRMQQRLMNMTDRRTVWHPVTAAAVVTSHGFGTSQPVHGVRARLYRAYACVCFDGYRNLQQPGNTEGLQNSLTLLCIRCASVARLPDPLPKPAAALSTKLCRSGLTVTLTCLPVAPALAPPRSGSLLQFLRRVAGVTGAHVIGAASDRLLKTRRNRRLPSSLFRRRLPASHVRGLVPKRGARTALGRSALLRGGQA